MDDLEQSAITRRALLQSALISPIVLGGSAMTSSQANESITGVPGIKVGHFTDSRRPTGCTVIMAEEGAVGGVDVRGAAPGTRETDLL